MDEREALRKIVDLTAQRDFSRSVEFKDQLLYCIAMLVKPWADKVHVL